MGHHCILDRWLKTSQSNALVDAHDDRIDYIQQEIQRATPQVLSIEKGHMLTLLMLLDLCLPPRTKKLVFGDDCTC